MAPASERKLLPKPACKPTNQSEIAATKNTVGDISDLRNYIPSNAVALDPRRPVLPPRNNPLGVKLQKTATRGRAAVYNPPHCTVQGCRLPLGCDVVYNPWNDRYSGIRIVYQKVAWKYRSPFQRKERSMSPKRRKLSHEEATNENSQDQIPTPIEPEKPFSEKSWLAMEFLLLVRHHLDIGLGMADDAAMEALALLMPDLDYEECFAMDLLRISHPGPTIYEDNEDETTEGLKLYNLHLKIYRMEIQNVNPTIKALRARLEKDGCNTDHILVPPVLDWDACEGAFPQDDEACNYGLLRKVGGELTAFCPRDGSYESFMENTLADVVDIQEKQKRIIEDQRHTRNDYLRRAELHAARIKAARDAIREVWKLEGKNVRVEVVRLKYESEGNRWPATWSYSITDAHIHPMRFAVWVDNLADKQYQAAKKPVDKWTFASVELNTLVAEYGSNAGFAHQVHSPPYSTRDNSDPASPTRKRSLSWSSRDSIPSNSSLNWQEEETQLLLGMSEEDAIRQAMEASMGVSQRPIKQKQPELPRPTIDQGSRVSEAQIDELSAKQLEWAIQMSMNPSLGEFPQLDLLEHLLRQQHARRHSGGMDGSDERAYTNGEPSSSQEGRTERKARSRSPPADQSRVMAKDRVPRGAGQMDQVLPSIEDAVEDDGAKQAEASKRKKGEDTVWSITHNARAASDSFRRESAGNHANNQRKIGPFIRVVEIDPAKDGGKDLTRDLQEASSGSRSSSAGLVPPQAARFVYSPAEVLKSRKSQWLTEDDEFRAILKSDKSIHELLMYHDFPHTRRCEAVLETVLKEETNLSGWAQEREEFLASRRIDTDIDNATITPEAAPSAEEVKANVATADEGQKARSLAIAAAYAKRPSVTGSSCVDGVATASKDADDVTMEPFPDYIGEADSVDAPMPVANMGVGRDTAMPDAPTNEAVADAGLGIDGGSSPNSKGLVAQCADSTCEVPEGLGEVQMALSEGAVAVGSGSHDVETTKVPFVRLTEIKPGDLAKEA